MLAGLVSLSSFASSFGPSTPDGGVGPPPCALRVAAGALIIAALISVPAFFVDIPALLKVASAVGVLLTVAAVVLMFSPRHAATVTD